MSLTFKLFKSHLVSSINVVIVWSLTDYVLLNTFLIKTVKVVLSSSNKIVQTLLIVITAVI